MGGMVPRLATVHAKITLLNNLTTPWNIQAEASDLARTTVQCCWTENLRIRTAPVNNVPTYPPALRDQGH